MIHDDPYFHNAKIPFGIYRNQLINTDYKKAISLLEGSLYAKHYPAKDNHYLVANIFHDDQFYVAHIPKDSVSKVLFLSEPFGVALAHTMMRFSFSSPIKLIAETPNKQEFEMGQSGKILPKPIILNDLIITVEATSPKGIAEFAVIASFFYTRGVTIRVISLTGRGVEKYLDGSSKVLQYRLNFSGKQANNLLDLAFRTSDQYGMSKMYQTLVANCNWFVFNFLDQSKYDTSLVTHPLVYLKKKLSLMLSRILFFGRIYPPLAKFGITWRKWRNMDCGEEINLEEDPEFLRLSNLFHLQKS